MNKKIKTYKILSIVFGVLALLLCISVIFLGLRANSFGNSLAKVSDQLGYAQTQIDMDQSKYNDCHLEKLSCEGELAEYRAVAVKQNQTLDFISNSLEMVNEELQECWQELNSVKSSPAYYYSSRAHPTNKTIMAIARENMKQFEMQEECEQYYRDAQTGEVMCAAENYGKVYYYDNLQDKSMFHYYIGAIIPNYYWVRTNIGYSLTPMGERMQSDLETLDMGYGKCSEQTILLASLLRSIGLDARYVSLPEINHAITAVTFEGLEMGDLNGYMVEHDDKAWFLMDTTCSYCEIGELPDQDIDTKINILSWYDEA